MSQSIDNTLTSNLPSWARPNESTHAIYGTDIASGPFPLTLPMSLPLLERVPDETKTNEVDVAPDSQTDDEEVPCSPVLPDYEDTVIVPATPEHAHRPSAAREALACIPLPTPTHIPVAFKTPRPVGVRALGSASAPTSSVSSSSSSAVTSFIGLLSSAASVSHSSCMNVSPSPVLLQLPAAKRTQHQLSSAIQSNAPAKRRLVLHETNPTSTASVITVSDPIVCELCQNSKQRNRINGFVYPPSTAPAWRAAPCSLPVERLLASHVSSAATVSSTATSMQSKRDATGTTPHTRGLCKGCGRPIGYHLYNKQLLQYAHMFRDMPVCKTRCNLTSQHVVLLSKKPSGVKDECSVCGAKIGSIALCSTCGHSPACHTIPSSADNTV